ncbi:MAG: LysR family transcriptional regulator [Parasphingopyxis sp.]|uniref:LysR family transcriptional regulator n=1 Tax=Parasphingopyxis sp. TaxID=1920299 RepID=UPI003FA01E6A
MKRLRHFVAVVDQRSFLRAADVINISQPALSLSIRELEKGLEVQLLDRTPTAVLPTVPGQQLYSHAVALLRDADAAKRAVAGIGDPALQDIRFGVGKSICARKLATAMQSLTARFPGVRLTAVAGTFAGLSPRLAAGELDFLLTRLPDDRSASDFTFRPLFEDSHIVFAGPDHPLARRDAVSLADLANARWVYGEPFEEVIPDWGAPFYAAELRPPRPVLHADSYTLIKAIVSSSDAISIMPAPVLESDWQAQTISILNTPDLDWTQECGLTVRRARSLSPIATAFVTEIETAYSTV